MLSKHKDSHNYSAWHSYSGFSLLEVMVAMAIFTIVGINMVKIISTQLMWSKSLEDKIMASWVADNILAEIKMARIEQTENWEKGRELMMNKLWYWQSRKIKTESEVMNVITVEVSSQVNSQEPEFILDGYQLIYE
ncbi:type II secretion system protein I [Yersinia rohdei]|uniref:Type II secretion system protein I n=1 Tax=Yersinia rohdei TaxID=29485 RepID=A0A0U1HWT9_YERRO|nr:type II secretion system minor pseudopilin GspI [Yersinia rohdei]AJJ09204.1 type II secretion system protein I [Yersinia rohdei]MDN0096770.1 type II secretion system minor pseudopilin GspI [Yersinia rohdei]CNE88117.1 general secretion pathway protein I [Yersinia rohdei]CNI85623.1 general secretion pathway protein I [Yersinia rohdei]CQI95714.1 general secretion pathway protein I [Yersinia rohdei]